MLNSVSVYKVKMIILPIIGLFISIRVNSRFSRYAVAFFGLNLFLEIYQITFTYMLNEQIIRISNPELIGKMISIPSLAIYTASYGVLFLALKNIK